MAEPDLTTAEARSAMLAQYGLEGKPLSSASDSAKMTKVLIELFEKLALGSGSDADPKKATMLFSAATKLRAQVEPELKEMIMAAVTDGRIASTGRLELAIALANKRSMTAQPEPAVTPEWFDDYIGVGVQVSAEEISRLVHETLRENEDEIKEKRYRYPSGSLVRTVLGKNRLAENETVLAEINKQIEQMLGPKTEADLAPVDPKAAKKAAKEKKKKNPEDSTLQRNGATDQERGGAGQAAEADPSEIAPGIPSSFEARHLDIMKNTPELLAAYKSAERTGGCSVMTRFPPEPNGHLHIGHAKAMFLDFGYARREGGKCYLRFDDTNPETEKQEYIDSIIDTVRWLGHEPDYITYSSDYFDELFALAEKLIKKGLAYVCHQSSEDIAKGRETMTDSPWRDRPAEESLRLFHDMANGKFEESAASLRMKIDMKHDNTVMRDPIAYRIKYVAHPRSGEKWCVYPSYDYTHCLVDSLEWITHSLCTLEFEVRRDSYYWLIAALDMYRPFVWEFARLTLEGTVVSKRKLLALVNSGRVRGWDDPRMPTLLGLRRRGYTPSAINEFCSQTGYSRNANVIGLHKLEHVLRSEFDERCPRAMCVTRPLEIEISNFDESASLLKVPIHPKMPEMGERDVQLTRQVFIERSDFRDTDEKGYYGLAPGKTAMLRYAYPITVTNVIRSDEGEVVRLVALCDYAKSVKPKGVLHWVSCTSKPCEVRLYDRLFKSADPGALGGEDIWEDLNDSSEVVLDEALVDEFAGNCNVGDSFQFERVGYFTCDQDSDSNRKVFNLTVTLKDGRK
ncbi:putative glutamine--tRNA ligase [Porphyridium purpureum]|uniref:glutamine--tRNA ligase n=1 Tax=Porphyridium purpureum TaxID=35688 RepID=A0A5J4YVQ6_PORPP|nr:putative glutamine--tRNA ligase [Porphyridium purpureum]|eukprot:POR6649..scf227_4